jgi:hypothetical protein
MQMWLTAYLFKVLKLGYYKTSLLDEKLHRIQAFKDTFLSINPLIYGLLWNLYKAESIY